MGTSLKREMQSLAASLSEHPVVMEMFGVGPALGPQLMAEIADVRRFHSKKALVAFVGIDPLHTSLDSWIFTAEASPNGVLPRCAERCSL